MPHGDRPPTTLPDALVARVIPGFPEVHGSTAPRLERWIPATSTDDEAMTRAAHLSPLAHPATFEKSATVMVAARICDSSRSRFWRIL